MSSAVEPVRRMSLAEEKGLTAAISSTDLADDIARRAYEVTSLDDLAALEESIEAGLPGLEGMLYEPLIFFSGPKVLPSSFENSDIFGVFEIARAKPAPGSKDKKQCDWVQDGERFLVSCGARNVVFGIAGCAEREELPYSFVIVTKKTGSNFDAYWPRPIDKNHPLPDKPKTAAPPRSVPVGSAPGDSDPL